MLYVLNHNLYYIILYNYIWRENDMREAQSFILYYHFQKNSFFLLEFKCHNLLRLISITIYNLYILLLLWLQILQFTLHIMLKHKIFADCKY